MEKLAKIVASSQPPTAYQASYYQCCCCWILFLNSTAPNKWFFVVGRTRLNKLIGQTDILPKILFLEYFNSARKSIKIFGYFIGPKHFRLRAISFSELSRDCFLIRQLLKFRLKIDNFSRLEAVIRDQTHFPPFADWSPCLHCNPIPMFTLGRTLLLNSGDPRLLLHKGQLHWPSTRNHRPSIQQVTRTTRRVGWGCCLRNTVFCCC